MTCVMNNEVNHRISAAFVVITAKAKAGQTRFNTSQPYTPSTRKDFQQQLSYGMHMPGAGLRKTLHVTALTKLAGETLTKQACP